MLLFMYIDRKFFIVLNAVKLVSKKLGNYKKTGAKIIAYNFLEIEECYSQIMGTLSSTKIKFHITA